MARANLRAGILYGEDHYRRLDPRFDVKMTVTAEGESFLARALEKVQVKLSFSEPFVSSGKINQLLGKGLPVSMLPGEVIAEGSLLLQTVVEGAAKRRGTMRLFKRRQGHVDLSRVNAAGREVFRYSGLPCEYEGGITECRFVARSLSDVLTIQGCCSDSQEPQQLSLNYALTPWFGKPLIDLPCYDLMEGFLGRVGMGERIRMEFYFDGVKAFSGLVVFNNGELKSVAHLLDALDIVSRAKWIANTCRLNPLHPPGFSPAVQSEVDTLYGILNDRQAKYASPEAKVETFLRRQDIEGGIGNRLFDVPTRLSLIRETDEFPFLGHSITIGPVEHQLTEMRLSTDQTALEKAIENGVGDVPAYWEASPQTELIIRRCSDQEIAQRKSATVSAGGDTD
jgi:hypothetical protein